MSTDKPLTPEDKLSVEINHLTVISLMTVCAADRKQAVEAVGKLSLAAAGKLLLSAVEIGGFLLRWSDKAEAAGGGVSVREILAVAAQGLSDELSTPPPTLH